MICDFSGFLHNIYIVGRRDLFMEKWIFVVGVLLMMNGVLADISISEPSAVYNLGDRLYIDLGGLRGANNGNLDINLVCENVTINMIRIPARDFASDNDQMYSTYKILDRADLGVLNLNDIVGTCQIVASLGGDVASSKSFEVSDDIDVSISLDKLSYNPGEVVSVSVGATKINGGKVNGFVEGSNASFFSGTVEEGVSTTSFNIPATAEAGSYNLNVRVYDVGSDGILNEGKGGVLYSVNQVATSLILSLSNTEVVPGNEFSVGTEVFDQSGVEMTGNVFVKVISPNGEEVENVVQAGEFVSVDFKSNSSVGDWKIVAIFDELVMEREFTVLPLQKVEFDFEDSVLIVRNVGNVLYNKTIDVNIGENVMTLDLKVGVGEVRKFSLKAPVGNYEVVVGDGDYAVTRQVMLTGNAVSISDFKGVGIFTNYSIVWIFLIVVFGGIGGVLFMRYRKTRTLGEEGSWFRKLFGSGKHTMKGESFKKKIGDKVPHVVKLHMDDSLNFTKKSPSVQGLDSENYSHEDKTMVDFTKKAAVSAESALVLKGKKYGSTVVAINVKNYEEGLSAVAKQGLIDIIENSKGKGLIDYRNDYIFVIFNPLATRTYKNEPLAVKCGMKIGGDLIAYNKKFKDKIDFGIGIHSGEIVASKEGDKLKYTGMGNIISFAKRMSDLDSGKVTISEAVRKKLIRDLKVVKGKDVGENMTYVVGEMRDGSGDAEKLKQLIKRGKQS